MSIVFVSLLVNALNLCLKMQKISVESLRRLQEEQNKGLKRCLQRITQFTKFRDDYLKLQKKLLTLPDKVSYDANVPFGSLAFMPGKLVHTNEILVLLGDDWFVERSAKQASEIVARRIADCDKKLADMKLEQTQYESWLKSTADVQSNLEGGCEIVEEYDEEKEKLWKEQHRLNVKKQKQMEHAVKNERIFEEDIWAKFDELEKLEAEKDEISMLDRLASETEEENEDYSYSSELSNDECDSDDDDDKNEDDNDVDEEDDTSAAVSFVPKSNNEESKKVKWKELNLIGQPSISAKNPSSVNVSFTDKPLSTNIDEEPHLSKALEQNVPCITSPADIYKHFATPSQPSTSNLKSILKPSSKEVPRIAAESLRPKDNSLAASSKSWMENKKPFSDTIVERNSPSSSMASSLPPNSGANIQTRRISKFKAARMAK